MGKLIALLTKYGPRAVAWAWNNAARVATMLSQSSPERVAIAIAQILGIV